MKRINNGGDSLSERWVPGQKKDKKDMEERNTTAALRSERVRSIVGQMPPRLIPIALTVVAAVLAVCIGIAYLLPYREVYSGTATLYDVSQEPGRPVALRLSFGDKRPPGEVAAGVRIALLDRDRIYEGELRSLNPKRDTLGRQEAIVLFERALPDELGEGQTDFTLTVSEASLLRHMIGAKRRPLGK